MHILAFSPKTINGFSIRLDGRLTMVDLNKEDSLNTLTLESRQDIWIPQLIFYNTEVKAETLNDDKAFATVHWDNSSFWLRNNSFLHNAYLYKGSENPIILNRVYSDRFICEYDVSFFPFDTQVHKNVRYFLD